MKILQICPNYSGAGGVSRYVKNISERLASKHDISVYTLDSLASYPRHEILNGVKIFRFQRIVIDNSYFFSWELPLHLRSEYYDVVHAHDYHAFPFFSSILSNRKRLFFSLHFHGGSHSFFRNILLKVIGPIGTYALNKGNKIIAVSNYEKQLITEQLGVNPSQIIVIPCGIKLKDFLGIEKKREELKTILFVGRLERYKNPHYLIEVLPYLPNYKLIIVGTGPLKEEIISRAEELDVSDRVNLYQNVPRENLINLYSYADIFALLSEYEAYSMVVAEALTAGTPCIVLNASALKEWIDEEFCFGIDSPIQISQIVDKIKMMERSHLINKNSIQNKYLNKKILDWEEVVSRIESTYEI